MISCVFISCLLSATPPAFLMFLLNVFFGQIEEIEKKRKALHNSKQEWTSESIHETCIHQTIQRQQQSAGKHAHILEPSVQPRNA